MNGPAWLVKRHHANRTRNRRRLLIGYLECLEERRLLATWSGDIPDGTIWTSAEIQSVVGNIRVPAGSTLTIQSGTIVKVNTFAGIDIVVEGRLLANGTSSLPVVFTSSRDDTGLDGILGTGDDQDTNANGPTNGVNGDWNSIQLAVGSSGHVFDQFQVRFGGASSLGSLVASVPLTLSNSLVRNSASAGVRLQTSNSTLNTNVFNNNSGAAISMDLASNPVISGVTVSGNGSNSLVLDSGSIVGNGFWDDKDIVYRTTGDITVPAGSTLTVGAGQVVKFRTFAGDDLLVDGKLSADGTPTSKIIFTSDRDDTAGGDTNNNGATTGVNGDWNSIQLRTGSSGHLLDSVEVRFGGANSLASLIASVPMTLTNSAILNSSTSGVRLQTSNSTLTTNAFSNNSVAAISMDLASNPVIAGVAVDKNGSNALILDSGAIVGDGFWDDMDIVYRLTGDVTVPVGKTLTIGAGQVVKFRTFTGDDLIVDGKLVADGTPTFPINFTSDRDDTVGGDTNNNGLTGGINGDWNSIQLRTGGSGHLLDNVNIRYGGANSTAALVASVPMTLTNSSIENSFTSGVRLQTSDSTLTANAFKQNSTAAISMDLASNPLITGVTMDKNGANALILDSGAIVGNGFWDDMDIVYRLTGDVTVPVGKTLTIGAGQVVKFRTFTGDDLMVDGKLIADGTPTLPITFTSDRDDSAGGDTNNNGLTGGVNGDWNSIQLGTGSSGHLLDNVNIRYGGANSMAALIASVPMSLTNSSIENSFNSGVRLQTSNSILTANAFKQNSTAALSMDLASNPLITGVTMDKNGSNALILDAGTMVGNGFWDDKDVVYRLTGDVTVPVGKTLTVGAGQVVKFRTFAGDDLLVDGKLIADGTPTHPISFTSDRDDTVGGDTNNNGPTGGVNGDWNSIQLGTGSAGHLLDNVAIRYGGANSAASLMASVPMTLTNSSIENSFASGVRLQTSNSTLTANAFKSNSTAAISMDLASNPLITGVTMDKNGSNALILDAGTMVGNGFWDDKDIVYRLTGDVTVPAGNTLTVGAGQVVKFRTFAGDDLIVDGKLVADGTLTLPIVFTSDRDDSAGGDTNNNGETGGINGDWGRIEFSAGSTGNVIDQAEFRYGGGGQVAMLFANGGSVAVTNSVIHHSFAHGIAALNNSLTTISSSLIYRNSDTGVRAESGANVTLANNTIDANSRGTSADGATTRLVLTNNLITNHSVSGVARSAAAIVTASFNDVFNPNASANYEGLTNPTGTNGNLSIDPKYFNPTNRQYELQAGSVAIDSGTSSGTPVTDFLGNPRFDDPNVFNTGSGTQPIVDRGAFERQQISTSNVDLQTTVVVGPATGLQDQLVTVNWTVRNNGAGPAIGSWHDAIYISVDKVWTPDDLFVGDKQHVGDLGPGQSYDQSNNIVLPGVLPGNYYFIVRSNSQQEVFEGRALLNNAIASTEAVAMDLPTLTPGTPLNNSLSTTVSAKFFKIPVSAGSDLAVSLSGQAGFTNELFLKFGDLPSRQSFAERGVRPNQSAQIVSVANTRPGNYFVMVFGANLLSSENITLTSSLTGFGITSISPPRGSNTGQVTIDIAGAQFDAKSQPRLVDSAGGVLNPTAVYFTDSGLVSATFNLAGRPLGLADIQVVNTGNVVTTLPDRFDIVAGQAGRLVTNLIAPSRVRLGRDFQVIIQYSNQGDTDLLAPTMHLSGSGISSLSLSPDLSDSATRLDLVGASSTGPAGIIPPGGQSQLTVYGRATAIGDEQFKLSVDENPDGPLDWVAIKPTLRPPGISDTDFDAIFAEVQTLIGNTFADYRKAISNATTLLPPLVGNNRSLNDVFSLILRRAEGNLTNSISGSLFLSDADHPLGNVRLELVEAVDDPQLILDTVSLNDGSFLITQVTPGTYNVTFDGFTSPSPIEVTIGPSDLNGLKFIVEAAGTIEGVVNIVPGGAPLPNVLVTATASDGQHFTTTVRGDGTFSLTGLGPDVYTVRAGGGDYTESQVDGVVVAQSEIVRHIHLGVQFGASISGKVTGPTGAVEGADVTVFGADGKTFTATTDALGNYLVATLPGQTYTVTAFAGGLFAGTPANVVLTSGQARTGINLSLSTAGGISGTTKSLVDGSIAGGVFLEAVSLGNSFTAQSDENGDFAISDLPPGNYVVTAFSSTLMTTSVPVVVKSGATQAIAIKVSPLGIVSGIVRAAGSNAPLANLVVSARNSIGEQVSALTDASGLYVLSDLDAGSYSIVVGHVGSPGATVKSVTLTAAAPDKTVDFSIAIAATVAGTVRAADGVTPVPFASVGLTQGGAPIATATSDELGNYKILALVPGNFQLETAATDLAFASLPISLPNGTNLKNQFLTAGAVSISGTVSESVGGAPIAGATISITQSGPGSWTHLVTSVISDATGKFTFASAVPGTYSLLVQAGLHASQQRSITVPAGGVSNLAFDLTGESTLQGTIRNLATGQAFPNAILTLVRDDNSLLQATVITDSMGAYKFIGLAPGNYTLVVRGDNQQTEVVENVTVVAGSGLRDFSLSGPGITVTGVVQNPAGTLGGILVTARDAFGFVVAQSSTADDGSYTLNQLPPGTHTLIAQGNGYTPTPVNITVTQGQSIANVNLAVSPVALAESFVTVAPADEPIALASFIALAAAAPATWLNDLIKQVAAAQQANTLVPSLSRIELLVASADEPCLTKYGDDARDAVKSVQREFFDLKSKFRLALQLKGKLPGLISDLKQAPRTVDSLVNQFPEILALVGKYLSTKDTGIFTTDPNPVLTSAELANFTKLFPTISISREEFKTSLSQALTQLQNGTNTLKERVASGEFQPAQRTVKALEKRIEFFQNLFQRWGTVFLGGLPTQVSEQGDFESDRSDLARIMTLIGSGGLGPNSLGALKEAINNPELGRLINAVEEFRQQRLTYFRAHAKALSKTLGLLKCTPEPKPKSPPASPPTCPPGVGSPGTPNPVPIGEIASGEIASGESASGESASGESASGESASVEAVSLSSLNLLRPGCHVPTNETQGPRIRTSFDPNDKIGPDSFGAAGFIQDGSWAYEIEFENAPELGATIPAQEVFVTDKLDTDLDLTTFEFGSFGFNNLEFSVPAGLSRYETTLDLRSKGIDLLVDVLLDVNKTTRLLSATFRSRDPLTALLPDDVDAGFLPVNDKTLHNGEGFFRYRVEPLAGLPTGTKIQNQAEIVFDVNAPILTPTSLLTIDAKAPTSQVASLSANSATEFSLSWSGTDDVGGSGIATYDIFVSDNGAAFTLFMAATTDTTAVFRGEANHSYAFYSVATDHVGLREQPPVQRDAQTTTSLLIDFGDAPAGYPVLFNQNGARHIIVGPHLGASVDGEADGQPTAIAAGDGADEDGVSVVATLISSTVATTSSFSVIASAAAKLDGWIDFNKDGDWLDQGEQVFSSTNLVAGINLLSFTVPATTAAGSTGARFRLSTAGNLAPTGLATDGEVEDYLAAIVTGNATAKIQIDVPAGDNNVTVEGDSLVVKKGAVVLFKAPFSSFGELNLAGSSLDDILRVTILEALASDTLAFDGGLGKDLLALVEEGKTLDLTAAKITLKDIEGIDITGKGTGKNKLVVSVDKVKAASSTTDTLEVIANSSNTIEFGAANLGIAADWKIGTPKFINGKFTHVITEATVGGTAEIDLQNDRLLLNPLNQYDADRDGKIQALDALRIINELRRRSSGPITLPTKDSEISKLYFDVSGDNIFTALDALRVINALSRIKRGGNPEGESQVPLIDLDQFVHRTDVSTKPVDGVVSESQGSSTKQSKPTPLTSVFVWTGPTAESIDEAMSTLGSDDEADTDEARQSLFADFDGVVAIL